MSTANDTIVPVGYKLEAYVGNLTPGKTYNLRVLAYSNGGDGRMSSPSITFQMGDYHSESYGYYSRDSSGYKMKYSSDEILLLFTILIQLYNDWLLWCPIVLDKSLVKSTEIWLSIFFREAYIFLNVC